MTFEEALKALKEGKKIRNNHWRQGFYVMLKDNKIVNNYGGIYFVYVRSFREDCWEEYKEPILDEAEKEYLGNIVKPYRDRVGFIVKTEATGYERIIICVLGLTQHNNYITLPYFYKNTMYKGMEVGKDYTLEELGL